MDSTKEKEGGLPEQLPVHVLREPLMEALHSGPVVLVAPTGTGKSTEVPLWLSGTALMIQPRRVACRAVATRLAQRLGCELGREVGYRVRDEDRSTPSTRLLVVTPGIVLQHPQLLSQFDTVLLDELHERRLDTDLICALLAERDAHFIAMSATLDGEKVAEAYGASLLEAHARTHPVSVEYRDSGDDLPDVQGLERACVSAVERLGSPQGDILVFLPGKAEIERVHDALREQRLPIVELHGGLSLTDQARVLSKSSVPRIILSTNVAETSLTVPGIRTVIDSGLVRRTAYHEGRSYLTLTSIALDSAEQRKGRAGRTAPGHCIRLWGQRARLQPQTPPEMHRESLVPLVLTAARLRLRPEDLRFIDPPHDYALQDARNRLMALGALESSSLGEPERLTERGLVLCTLPLDAWLSRILVEAQQRDCLNSAIDLVALLDHPQAGRLVAWAPDDQLERNDCDLCAALFTMRAERPSGVLRSAWEEAQATAARLRRAFSLAQESSVRSDERDRLLRTILLADRSAAYVARRRKRETVFSNGGTELALASSSRSNRRFRQEEADRERPDALVALATRGTAHAPRKRSALITLASPVERSVLADLELGTETLRAVSRGPAGRVFVHLERSYSGRILSEKEVEPQGALARDALTRLFMEGRWLRPALVEARARLSRRGLAADLGSRGRVEIFKDCTAPPDLREHVSRKLAVLGVESAQDAELLSPEDLLPDDVPNELRPSLDERFPQEIDLGDSVFRAEYDLEKHQVLLSMIKGNRKKPPPPNYLPKFPGFSVFIEVAGTILPMRR